MLRCFCAVCNSGFTRDHSSACLTSECVGKENRDRKFDSALTVWYRLSTFVVCGLKQLANGSSSVSMSVENSPPTRDCAYRATFGETVLLTVTTFSETEIHDISCSIVWHMHRESKKQDTKLLPITSPNINRFSKFFFTSRLRRKSVTKQYLNTPPHPKCVATLPCEISMFRKSLFLRSKWSKLLSKT